MLYNTSSCDQLTIGKWINLCISGWRLMSPSRHTMMDHWKVPHCLAAAAPPHATHCLSRARVIAFIVIWDSATATGWPDIVQEIETCATCARFIVCVASTKHATGCRLPSIMRAWQPLYCYTGSEVGPALAVLSFYDHLLIHKLQHFFGFLFAAGIENEPSHEIDDRCYRIRSWPNYVLLYRTTDK